jgi:GntR family transcriptional regulator
MEIIMRKIDRKSSMPLYLQVDEIIRESIEYGKLKEGDTLMSERDISEFLGVSRMTVNKAITKLESEGYIIRESRKGTFIAKKRSILRYENLDGLTEMKKKVGKSLSNQLVSFEEIELYKWMKRELQTTDDQGYKIKRVRYVDNEPLVLETIFLSRQMCPGLSAQIVEVSSMFELYTKKYGHKISQAEQVIRPLYLKGEEAKLLGQKNGDLALSIKRHTYSDTKEIIEYSETIFLSNKHDLQIALR